MKKIILTGVFILCAIMSFHEKVYAMTGSGTSIDPYTIYNCTDLQNINTNLNANYQLANDIDCSMTNAWNGGLGFDTIGDWLHGQYFNGSFDGKGHVIYNLYINRSTEDYVGLFSYVNSQIVNVQINNANVTGGSETGILCGECAAQNITTTGIVKGNMKVGGIGGVLYNENASSLISSANVTGQRGAGGIYGDIALYSLLKNSYATGNVTATGDSIGGLVGILEQGGQIQTSYATGNISSSSQYVGGLVGGIENTANRSMKITDSYATGNVSGSSSSGGLVGFIDADSNYPTDITNSYSEGAVTGTTKLGGLIGEEHNPTYTVVTNAYYDKNISSQSDVGKGTPYTSLQMKNQTNYSGWDFNNTWEMEPTINNGYPYLRVFRSVFHPNKTNTNIQIQSGEFSLTSSFSNVNFGTIIIDGTQKNLPISIDDLVVKDYRGTAEGWNLIVQATPFTSINDAGKKIPTNTLTFNGIKQITQLSGTSILPTITNNEATIDSGAVKILSSAIGNGMGGFNIAFPLNSLTLSMDTASLYSDAYQSTITWTLVSGP